MRRLRTLHGVLAAATCLAGAAPAWSAPAAKGPDFQQRRAPASAVASDLSASDARRTIDPMEIVQFEFGSAILDAAGRAQLDGVARWLKAHPDQVIVLEGHTDVIGSDAYNSELAARRANAIRDALSQLGVAHNRMLVAVYGEAPPQSPNRSANRRVVIYPSGRTLPPLVSRR